VEFSDIETADQTSAEVSENSVKIFSDTGMDDMNCNDWVLS